MSLGRWPNVLGTLRLALQQRPQNLVVGFGEVLRIVGVSGRGQTSTRLVLYLTTYDLKPVPWARVEEKRGHSC